MGVMHFPRLEDYWQTKCSYLMSKVFPKTRYEQILRFLHVSDRENEIEDKNDPNYDKLQKVRPLMDILDAKFWNSYDPQQHLAVDEAMIPYKGRIGLKQYMKAKPHKWGIKVFVLANSTNGYISRYQIYTGKNYENLQDKALFGLCTQAVVDLVPGLEYKGHIIITDNYYTSPLLYRELSMPVVPSGQIELIFQRSSPRSNSHQRRELTEVTTNICPRAQ